MVAAASSSATPINNTHKESTRASPNSINTLQSDPSPRLLLILEFASNGTMWDYVMSTKSNASSTSLNRIVWQKWARQLSSAVAHIHSLGIIHHDIKPHNILITESLDVKLCDFGNAAFTTPLAESNEVQSTASEEVPISPLLTDFFKQLITPGLVSTTNSSPKSTHFSASSPLLSPMLNDGLGRGTQGKPDNERPI